MSRFGALTGERSKDKKIYKTKNKNTDQSHKNIFKTQEKNVKSSRFQNLAEMQKKQEKNKVVHTVKQKEPETVIQNTEELFPELNKPENVVISTPKPTNMNYASLFNKSEVNKKETQAVLKPGWIYLNKESIQKYTEQQKKIQLQKQMEDHERLCNKMLHNMNIRHKTDRTIREYWGEDFYKTYESSRYENMSDEKLIVAILKISRELTHTIDPKYRNIQYDLIKHINAIETKMQAMNEDTLEAKDYINNDEDY